MSESFDASYKKLLTKYSKEIFALQKALKKNSSKKQINKHFNKLRAIVNNAPISPLLYEEDFKEIEDILGSDSKDLKELNATKAFFRNKSKENKAYTLMDFKAVVDNGEREAFKGKLEYETFLSHIEKYTVVAPGLVKQYKSILGNHRGLFKNEFDIKVVRFVALVKKLKIAIQANEYTPKKFRKELNRLQKFIKGNDITQFAYKAALQDLRNAAFKTNKNKENAQKIKEIIIKHSINFRDMLRADRYLMEFHSKDQQTYKSNKNFYKKYIQFTEQKEELFIKAQVQCGLLRKMTKEEIEKAKNPPTAYEVIGKGISDSAKLVGRGIWNLTSLGLKTPGKTTIAVGLGASKLTRADSIVPNEEGFALGRQNSRDFMGNIKLPLQILPNTPTDNATSDTQLLLDSMSYASRKQQLNEKALVEVPSHNFDKRAIGDEFIIPQTTDGDQTRSTARGLAVSNDGTTIVEVWTSTDGNGTGVYIRLFNAITGEPITDEKLVNTYDADDQRNPDVVVLKNDRIVVVWESFGRDTFQNYEVSFQIFDESANKVGDEVQVNNAHDGDQTEAKVAALDDGGFCIFWADKPGTHYLSFKRYDANGGVVVTDKYTSSSPDPLKDPTIKEIQPNRIAVAYAIHDKTTDDPKGLKLQFRDNNLDIVGSEVTVSADGMNPDISPLCNGYFVVTYTREVSPDVFEVFGRAYNTALVAQGDEFKVTDGQNPAVICLDNGTYAAFYECDDGSGKGICGKTFDASGTNITAPVAVNVHTDLDQQSPSAVRVGNSSDIAVSWESEEQDTGNRDVFARIRNWFSPTSSTTTSTSEEPTSSSTSKDPTSSTNEDPTSSTSEDPTSSSSSSSDKSSESSSKQNTDEPGTTPPPETTEEQTSIPPETTTNPESSKITHDTTQTDNIKDEPEEEGTNWWLWGALAAAGAGVCAIGTGTVIAIKKKLGRSDYAPETNVNLETGIAGTPHNMTGELHNTKSLAKKQEKSSMSQKREERIPPSIGGKYWMYKDLTKSEAKELFKQTGIEVTFEKRKKLTKAPKFGKGQFGCSKLARIKKTGEFIIVKDIKDKDRIQASDQEGIIQAKLSKGKNLLPILDYVEIKEDPDNDDSPVERLYRFMPLASFGNAENIRDYLYLLKNPEDKERVLTHVAKGLLKGNRCMQVGYKMCHLDNKPSNLVITRKGEVYVIDFGCAQEIQDGRTGNIFGDSSYFSPERLDIVRQSAFNRPEPITINAEKTEAWAIGISLLEIAIGRHPLHNNVSIKKENNTLGYKVNNWTDEYIKGMLNKIEAFNNPTPDSYMEIVNGLLKINPDERIGFDEALQKLSKLPTFSNDVEREKLFANFMDQIKAAKKEPKFEETSAEEATINDNKNYIHKYAASNPQDGEMIAIIKRQESLIAHLLDGQTPDHVGKRSVAKELAGQGIFKGETTGDNNNGDTISLVKDPEPMYSL